ncbi:MAG: aminotransferase class I/II-fold pyridoxal phosphate-dependent enzyme [Acidobacteriota bacterium]|nr:aminotransferase class I/II-fold pyridoxal phosphate-dependent enzyme [Acidobacteriota bacterium]
MNTYRKKNYRGKRGYSGRPHRRTADSYHQPLPPDQNRIPYSRHTLTKPDVEAVVDALLSGTLTQGRELERFESLLAKLTHSDYAVAFSSGTSAIHAALACLKLEPEDEVITSTLTFCSVANMVRLVGARVVLADCDPNTLTLSVESAKSKITEHTKVIFTNNFAGHPSDLVALRELCDEHNLLLLEDASHGLGGKYRGHYVGNQADLTCFSFHPSKAITTCEGGAVTTNNRVISDRLRLFRHHGIQKDPRYFQNQDNLPDFYQELQFQGMNYRLSEIHAALGRSQLTRLDRHIERRRSIAQVYYQKLGSVETLILPYVADWADSAFHIYPIQFTGVLADKRDEIFKELKAAGIDVQVHYIPLHRMPLYAGEYGTPADFPNAETYFGRCLTLPLFPDLSYKELERITELVMKAISKYLPDSDETETEEIETDTDEDFSTESEMVDDYSDEQGEESGEEDGDDLVSDEDDDEDEVDSRDLENEERGESEEETGEPEAESDTFPEPPTDTANPAVMPDLDDNIQPAAKPKRLGGRLRKVPKTASVEAEDAKAEEAPEKPKATRTRRTRKTTRKTAEESAETGNPEDKTEQDGETKPKVRRTRKTSTRTTRAKDKDGDAEAKPTRRRTRKTKTESAESEKAASAENEAPRSADPSDKDD